MKCKRVGEGMSSESINKAPRASDNARESKLYRRPDARLSDRQQVSESDGHLDARQTAGLSLDRNDYLDERVEDGASTAEQHEVCMICGESHEGGLHLGGQFICAACEREIVQTDVSDAKYPYFIHRMKQLWQRKNA